MMMVSTFFVLFVAIGSISAKSRFVRQIEEDGSGSDLNFIDFNAADQNLPQNSGDDSVLQHDEGSGAPQLNFINFDDASQNVEGSGMVEGSGTDGQHLMFDDGTAEQPNEYVQSINLTDSNVDTLVIKVHLPSRDTTDLLEQLKDDTALQTNLPNNLDMAVSLTNILNDLLGRIQTASTD